LKARPVVKKICILGDPAVGKTSLVGRFVRRQFGEDYLSTIGASVMEKSLELDTGGRKRSVELVIWDIAGQHQFTSVTPGFYRGAEGALLVCDLTRRETLRNLFRWDHQFRSFTSSANAVILFNKSDLAEKCVVTGAEAEAAARQLEHPHMMTSAKSGENVEDAFRALAEKLLSD
jgi:small GTP-binding protein